MPRITNGSASGGAGGDWTYTNLTPTLEDLGGWPAGSTFNAVPKQTLLDTLFYPYLAPNVTTDLPATATIEFPLAEPTITIQATSVKQSDDITSADLQVSLNGGAYATVYNEAAVNPNGQTYSTMWQPSDDFAWPLVQVNQVSTLAYRGRAGDGTTTTNASAHTQTYVYPFYYGVGAPGLSGAQIAALTKLVQTQGDKTLAFAPTVEVYYFAYPASYPDLTRILDQNLFDITADFTLRNPVSITGADGTAQNYKVYEFNNLTSLAQNLTFDF